MTFKQSASTGMLHVKRVKEDGAAERVDIRAGDVILSLDGQALQNMEKKALSRLMLGPPGSAVEVGMQRKDATRVHTLTLIRGDGVVASEASWRSEAPPIRGNDKVGLGLTFVRPDEQPGVVIKRVKEGGAAEATGQVMPGTFISHNVLIK